MVVLLASSSSVLAQCDAFFTYSGHLNSRNVNFGDSTQGNYNKVTWDFGDGTTLTQKRNVAYTSHVYSAFGTYKVCRIVEDSTIPCKDTFCQTIDLSTPNCNADFRYTISGNTVRFTYTGTTSATYYSWTFGDPRGNSNSKHPTYTYAGSGTYDVCLFISTGGPLACFDTVCQKITIAKKGCDADFTATNIGQGQVRFNAKDSRSGVVYNWDFGDGNTHTNRGTNHPTHQYNTASLPDSFTVCMNMYDSVSGCRDTICKNVYVTNDSCDASFRYTKQRGNVVVLIPGQRFTNNVTYKWTVLGQNYTSRILTHTFARTGKYSVCLEVYDSTLNCRSISCDSITIDSASCDVKANFSYTVVDSTGTFTNLSRNAMQYKWLFPGNTTSTATNPVNTFTGPGRYTVCLVAKDTSLPGCVDTICKTVVIDSAKSCMAFFRIALDTTKKFKLFLINGSTNKSSHTYKWTFGDGNSSTKRNPSHKYQKFGLYQVCLTVADTNNRCSDTYCDSLGLDSNGRLLKADGFELVVVEDNLSVPVIPEVDYTLYPNPTNGLVTIKLESVGREGAYVQVYSLTGKMVKDISIENLNSLTFDMVDVENGMYVVRIFDGENHAQTKLIKMYK